MKPFTPPTLDDLTAYASQIGAPPTFDPQQFLDYWEARGWYMRPGIRMASWRAAVRTFIRNQRNWSAAAGNAGRTFPPEVSAAIDDYALQAANLMRHHRGHGIGRLYAKIRDALGPEAVDEVRRRAKEKAK